MSNSTKLKFEFGALAGSQADGEGLPETAVCLVGKCYLSDRNRPAMVLAVFRAQLGDLCALVCEVAGGHAWHHVLPVYAVFPAIEQTTATAAYMQALECAEKERAKAVDRETARAEALKFGLIVGDYAITRVTKTTICGYHGNSAYVCSWSRKSGRRRDGSGFLPADVQSAVREYVGGRELVDIVAERKDGGQ